MVASISWTSMRKFCDYFGTLPNLKLFHPKGEALGLQAGVIHYSEGGRGKPPPEPRIMKKPLNQQFNGFEPLSVYDVSGR